VPAPETATAPEAPPPGPLRVLITNRSLAFRSGTELYVAELAHALLARGHTPILYAPRRGELAEQLRRQSVVVRSSLADMQTAPDVIHGHHRVATMTALTRFPGVPVISFAHDFTHPDDTVPIHPAVGRYVAVDETNRDRLLDRDGVDAGRVAVRLNWFDAKRFRPRETALPIRPKRALVLSIQAVEGAGFLPVLRAACERFGIALDVVGLGVGNVANAPEAILGTYDIVFAKARAAIESMASGCATILCDAAGFGGLVTTERVAELRRLNFGLRSLRSDHDVEVVARAIAAYDASDAADVSAFIRRDADMDTAVDGLVELYRTVMREADELAARPEEQEVARATSVIFEAIGTQIVELEDHWHFAASAHQRIAAERDEISRRLNDSEADAIRERERADHADERAVRATEQATEAMAQAERTHRELRALAHDHRVMLASATFRVRDALVRRRWLLRLWRTLRRSSARDASGQPRM
jgi:hypothetical protein